MPQTTLEEGMAKVEGILEQMAERLNHIETEQISLREGQEQLRTEFTQGHEQLRRDIIQGQDQLRREFTQGQEGLRKEVRSEIRSLYNLIIIMWVTIILSLGGLFATMVSK